jgi:hypothetical protein
MVSRIESTKKPSFDRLRTIAPLFSDGLKMKGNFNQKVVGKANGGIL